MQSKDKQTGTPGDVIHPDAAEWMAFLYAEVAPARKREMEKHLAQCAACAAQVKSWRSGMSALDAWELPAMPRVSVPVWQPVLKWAAAAAVVLAVGFVVGRQTASDKAELAAIKNSVAQLAESVGNERTLLADYINTQATQRTADQETMTVAMKNFDTRLRRLRAELETVAVNTESGFEQTKENLARLVAYSQPADNQLNAQPTQTP